MTLPDLSTPGALEKLMEGPALPPPPGVVSNFDHPPNLEALGFFITIFCLVLSTILVFIRIYIKLRLSARLNREDYFLLVTWFLYAAWYYTITFMVQDYAPGLHQWDMRFKRLGRYLLVIHLGQITYGVVIMLLKISILTLFLKLFVPHGRKTIIWWACHILIWMNVIFYVSAFFLEIFTCTPPSKFWKPLMQEGKCMNKYGIIIGTGAINTLSDFIILLLPQKVIWELQMATRKRSALSGLFIVGIIGSTASAVRLYYTVRLSQTSDITYYSYIMGLCSYPEITSGFMVICTPIMPKFFKRIAHKPAVEKVIGPVHDAWVKRRRINPFRETTLKTQYRETQRYYETCEDDEELVSGPSNGDSSRRTPSGYQVSIEPQRPPVVKKTIKRADRSDRVKPSDPLNSQIIRTVEIASVVETKRESQEEADFEAQHPWSVGMGISSTKTSAQNSGSRSAAQTSTMSYEDIELPPGL